MTKKTYRVKGMHCVSCPLVLEGELEDIGVKASCSYASESLTVEYDDEKVTEENIRDTVKLAGYDVMS